MLVVKLKQKAGNQTFRFRLLPAISKETFVLRKLRPTHNNLRSMTETPTSAAASKDGETEPKLLPTPHYNNSILQVIS